MTQDFLIFLFRMKPHYWFYINLFLLKTKQMQRSCSWLSANLVIVLIPFSFFVFSVLWPHHSCIFEPVHIIVTINSLSISYSLSIVKQHFCLLPLLLYFFHDVLYCHLQVILFLYFVHFFLSHLVVPSRLLLLYQFHNIAFSALNSIFQVWLHLYSLF